MKCYSYYEFFKNFANNTRFKIILLLKNKTLTVSEIANKLNKEQSLISHNLKKLTDCHIINYKKQGKTRLYSLNKKTVIPMLNLVEKHVKQNCCGGCNKNESLF